MSRPPCRHDRVECTCITMLQRAVVLGATEAAEGQVKGECGHPMEPKDWVFGWRVCERCPQDLPEYAEPVSSGTASK